MADPQKRTYSIVYNALKQISDEEGIDFGLDSYSEEQFKNKYFTGPGNINNLYNKLSQISDEEGVDFGLGTRSEWLGSFGFTEEDAMPSQGYKPTAKDMAGFNSTIRNAGRTVGSSLGNFDSKVQNLQKRQGLNVPSRIEVGKSNNLVQGSQHLNPETGELENTYITSSGNEYDNEALADMEQRQIDQSLRDARYKQSLPGQLDDAYAERDRLNAELAKLQGQWVDQDGRVHYGNRGSDEAAASLEAALRQNQQRITALEAERDDDGGTQFWRGFMDAAKNPSTLTFGMTDFNDMIQMMRIKNKMDAAVESGQDPQLSEAEQALLESSYLNNYAQSQYGENRGFMYRAGGISMQALPFVAEFMATGGMGAISQKGAEVGTRAAEKLALQGLSRSLVKNLGVLAGDVAAGWAMANTTGIFRTAGDVMQRNMGGVTINPEGQYDFGSYDDEGNYHRGGKSLGRSIYEAEVANTLEYYTEKLGEHMKLGKRLAKGAEKLGLSKLSKAVNYLSNNKWLEHGGIQDYPSEVVEEEANLILNAALVGDNKFGDLVDGKTQLDIWGGMLFSIGLMQAPQLAYTGYSAAGYYAYKKNVDMADGNASIVFGADNWQMIKDEIDNCENDRLAELMQTVIDGDMTDVQKTATMNYAKNLVKMRGYNMGMMAGVKDEEEATSNEGMAAQAVNQSYQQGHETQDPDLMKQFNNDVLEAEQNLHQYGEEFAKEIVDSSEKPVVEMEYLMGSREYFTDDQIAAAADYYTKQARAKGMMEGALDRIDLQVEQANAEVRVNTHQQTGDVVMAKGNDSQDYYIIGGEIVTDPETGMTSLAGTGGAVVVRDLLGNVSVKSPQDLIVYSMQPAEELININETDLRQRLMKQADDDITFGSPANEVYQLEDTVTLQDADGNVVEGQIGMMPNAVDGVYVVYTTDGKAMQYTADDLNRMIVAHNGMEVQRGAQQPMEQPEAEIEQNQPENAQIGENYAQNQPENIQSGAEVGESAVAEDAGQEEIPQSALSRIPVATDEKGQPITDKKGRPQYQWHKASVEDAAAALIETTGGDMVMARDTANDLVNVAKGKLEKIRKQKPKGEDPIEIAESRQEIKRAENEVQATIRQWQDVAQNIGKQINAESERIRQEAEAKKSAEQKAREAEEARIRKEKQEAIDAERRRKKIEEELANWNKPYAPLAKAKKEMEGDPDAMEILNRTEPETLDEWVSSLLRPQSMMWEDETDPATGRKIIGLQSELGLQKKDIERIGGLVATKQKGGKPFGTVVHDIWEDLPEGMRNMYDDQDVRNALIGLFGEGNTVRMRHLTEEHRIEEAREMVQENLKREVEAELEAWAESYHLTPEEREAFEDYLAQAPLEPEQEIINNIIADESYRISKEEDRQSDSRADVSGSERGESQVQQTAEATGNGADETGTAQAAEGTTGESPVSDDAVSGEGGVIPTPKVDMPRFKKLRRGLADAYSAAVDRGDPKDLQAISKATLEVRIYVDQGLDDYREYEDGIEDYEGDDPEKLADQYITRLYHDRYVDNDEDEEYILSGLKPHMRQHNPFIEYDGKIFETNDNGICVNPNVIEMHEEKNNVNIGYEIRTALSDRGWVGHCSVDGPTYGWGGGVSAGWYDEYFETEAECQAYWAKQALDYLKQHNDPKMKKYEVGLQDIIDKSGKKNSIADNTNGAVEATNKGNQNDIATPKEPVKRPAKDTPEGEILVKGGTILKNNMAGDEAVALVLGSNIDRKTGKRRYTVEYYSDEQAAKERSIAIGDANIGQDEMRKHLANGDFSSLAEWQKQEEKKEEKKSESTEPKRLVSDARMEELKKKLRKKLGGQVNVGVDPEILAIGAEMAVGYIERGITKFADYAKAMIDEVGDFMRPYLKSFYNAVRDMPEAEGYADQMDDYETVRKFDVHNFDKDGKVPDAITKAEQIVNEQKVQKQVKKIKKENPNLFVGDLFGAMEEQQPIGKTSTPAEIATEEAKVDTNPTEAQKEAGNYQKGHIQIDGYDITIENPKGSIRRGVDADGKPWEITMNNTYGYIRGTEATDGDHIDVFLSDDPTSGNVFVVDQVKPDGSFDEIKVMYGFKGAAEATQAYLANYSKGWKGLGAISGVSREKFKEWVNSSHRKTKPFREYAMVKAAEAKKKTPWWKDPNRPQSIDPSDYKTYMTDEAKEYFANYVSQPDENGKITDFTKWAHPNLAYITAAVWDEVEIPYEDLKNVPEIAEAENTIKIAEAKGKLQISDEEANDLAQRLIDSGEARQERKAFVIIGLPAGGKSSVFANPLSKQYGARIIDSDDVKPWLKGFDGGNGAGYVQDASAEVAEKAIDIAVKNGDNIIIPRIGGKSVMDLSAALRLAGYDVQLYFNDVKGVTSIDRAASRFAQTGRYLSLDYLTKKAGVPSENFSKFAEKTIGGYLDERSKEEVQEIRRRVQGLRGELYGSGSGLWESLAAKREGTGETEGAVQADLGGKGLQTGSNDISVLLTSPLFNYSEWKSNDVPIGQKPKEIWNSKSGKPLPTNERKENETERKVSTEPESAGEGTGQTSGSADRTGTERSPEQNRVKRSGSGSSIETPLRVPDGREARGSSERPTANSTDSNTRGTTSALPKHNNRRNNVGERGKDYAPLSPKARFNANVEAIKLMRLLNDEGIEAAAPNETETALRDQLIDLMKDAGIDVITDNAEAKHVLDEANGKESLSRSKKRALETAVPKDKSSFKATVISSADGAKVVKNLENLAKKSEKLTQGQKKSFISDVATALGAEHKGSGSQYATFETKNGNLVTIRLADHNATVSGFDHNDIDNGISIVISRKPNEGMTNDGNAHIVEFFYPDKALRNADDGTYSDIVRSIQQSLYSGEYKDTTGLAEREEVNGRPVMQQKVEMPIFYSNAMKAVEAIKQEKATPDQWIAMLQKNGGMKAGEDKWIGLSDWLTEQKESGKSVTKQEVMDYIRQNQIQVEEQSYREYFNFDDNSKMQEFRKEYSDLLNKYEEDRNKVVQDMELFNQEMYDKYGRGWANDLKKLDKEDRQRNDYLTKRYNQLNDNNLEEFAFADMVEKYGDDFGKVFEVNYDNGKLEPKENMYGYAISDAAKHFLEFEEEPINSTRLDYTTKGLDNNREIALTVPKIEPWDQSDTLHFGDAGGGRAIAWVRFGETTADGNRVLVIDEIQSKRHQEGRKEGYKDSSLKEKADKVLEELKAYRRFLYDKYPELRDMAYLKKYATPEEYAKENELTKKHNELEGLVFKQRMAPPSAPFEKNWQELAMKRMLRYAAENDYDKIAWTTGEQQAKRYDIGNVIREIYTFEPDDYAKENGEYLNIQLTPINNQKPFFVNVDKDGKIMSSELEELRGKSLGEVVGKELAVKLMSAEPGTKFADVDLRVGGEGMKGFYDEMLPRFMNKYGKKWGVKVGQVDLPDLQKSAQKMWSVDVTPDMKESVMQGQPMFFKTRDGHAYGYTYKGKIYLDPRIATAETPIHEYTHLWAEALRQKDPETWKQIVDVLKNDDAVRSFWDKVAQQYPELTDENDIAEEVLAQYSGRRGSEQLREVADGIARENKGIFGKAQAVEALRRMKNVLAKFWKAVADMMGWKYTSAQDIADKVLYDLLSGVKPDAEGRTAVMEQRADDTEPVDPDDVAMETYNRAMQNGTKKWQEAWQDSMISLRELQDAIAQQTGNKAKGAEDAYSYENRMHGRSKNMGEQYDWQYYQPILKAFDDFCKAKGMTDEQAMDYLVAKHGLERNMYYGFRDALKRKVTEEIKEEREKLEKAYALGRISEDVYKDSVADLREREMNGVDDAIQQLQDSEEYNRLKDDYKAGRISYNEFMKGNEELRREATRRKKPRMDREGHIISDNYYDETATDYSGLTETFAKQPYDEAQKIKRKAQREIDPEKRKKLWQDYDLKMREAYALAKAEAEGRVMNAEREESPKPASETASGRLWDTINAATKKTLQHSYESGMMNRKNYDKVRRMFDFYIPLRGWDENRAGDVYSYVGRDNVFSPAVKKTWGRKSKADSPLAYIGNIAMSTIIAGHQNQMKQHFLNYVLNNPTSLVSISESWYENIGTERNPIWILRSADTAGKSADEIAQIVNDFNEEMAQKQAEGKAIPVRGRLRLDVHATQGQKAEHVVEVQQAGRTYQVYINGDPRAAQALNGTLPKAVTRISNTATGKLLANLNRNMAAFFTSKNPAFVVSNLSRDLNMAGASVAIKEDPAYNAQFIKNVAKVLAPRMGESSGWNKAKKQPTGLMPSLLRKWKKGTLDTTDETEHLFKEFMDEGGETGFVNMLSVDSFKEKMQKEIAQMHGSDLLGRGAKECSIRKGLRLMGETFEFYNRCAEDATRFIVYMTSRQMGKTLEESIADAKDVTLNFNRKGTGARGNAEIRDLFIFVNPAIQALANMYKMMTGRPLKFAGIVGMFFAGGMLMPIINQWLLNMFGDDDDKEAYWNLPPWIRKNNLVMWIPFTKNFLTIPLAQEFRVFYGAGEMLSTGLTKHQVNRPVYEVLSSVADLVPINPTGNGGNLMIDLAPTGIQPIIQLTYNTDFTGKPIWKENQGNKHAPMYTKAYVTTPNWMISFSEKMNDWTGGNEGKKGLLDQWGGDYVNNPAVWNHLLQGYLGGMYNTIAKTADVVYTAANKEMPKVMQMPVINRFLNRPVERDNAGVLGDDYYSLKDERDALNCELRVFRQKAADGDTDAQKRIDEILSSDEWKKAEVFNHYEKIMKDLSKGEQAATESADKGDIKKGITDFKQQMMEELNAIGGGRDPLEVAEEQFRKAKTFEERNKLRMRIERLMTRKQGADKNKAKPRTEEVEKALGYITTEEDESRDVSDKYLMLATPENIRDDARIKAAKAKINEHMKEYKRLMDSNAFEKANEYRAKNVKWFTANDIINQQERAMSTNKKLLGQGRDAAILKFIDANRSRMLKAIEDLGK